METPGHIQKLLKKTPEHGHREILSKAIATGEVQIVVPRRAGDTLTPRWTVSTMDQVLIRSYRADKGRWFQYAIGADRFSLEFEGELMTVKPTRVADPITLSAIDAGYSEKCPVDEELADMLTPEVIATTLTLMSLDKASGGA